MQKTLLPLLIIFVMLTGAACADDGAHIYRDPAGVFSIRIPPGWNVNPKFVDYGYGYYQGSPDDKLPGVAFVSRRDFAPGTNLDSGETFFAVQVLPAKTTCVADSFLVDPPPDYFTTEPEDTADFARTVAEPGDLDGYEEQVRVLSHSPCVAMHVFITYSQRATPKFDRARLLGMFDAIAKTVTVRRR